MRRLFTLTLTILLGASLYAENYSAGAAKHYKGIKLVDQNGKRVGLYDLMKGRTIVLHSFRTNCEKHCSLQMAHLQAVQAELAEKMGKELWFVSVTVDPQNDTAGVLKTYADGYAAGPGWSFLTGTQEEVDKALKSFNQLTDSPSRHRGTFLIGKESTGQWREVDALVAPATIRKVIEFVMTAEPLKLPAANERR